MSYFRDLAADATENFLRNFVREGDTVLDVGANIGQSALVAAVLAGGRGHVVSFEPNPAAFAGLQAAVQCSGLHNITTELLALSDRSGRVEFFVDTREEYTAVASSLRQLDDLVASGKSKPTSVLCMTLDDYCAANGLRPNVIKIDVESAEPLVIEGGRSTIETLLPIMLFEFWETWWNRGFRELFGYLAPMYRLIRMQDGVDVENFYEHSTGSKAVDILCLPRRQPAR
jgi:FkbM family methyltransferase